MIKRFAQHRVAANLTMIMMTLVGLWAIRSMPSQLDPPTALPLVFVEVQWRGASAEDVEALVTTPIEAQLRTLDNLHELDSRSTTGYMGMNVQFNYGTDITLAMDQIKQYVANVRNLPTDIEPPIIRRYIDYEPVAELLLTGPGSLAELVPIVRAMEQDLLARGIEQIRFDGLPVEEIALMVGGKRLHELDLTLNDLAGEIARVSQNVPAGSVGSGHGSRQLRGLDQKRDPISFEQLQIESNRQLIRLGDIAEVVKRPQRGQPGVTRDGHPAIEMVLLRDTATDAMLTERILNNWLTDIRPTLPEGVDVAVLTNVWDLLGAQLSMITENGISGLVLVILILFLFLNGRVGWWVTLGIPVSFLFGLALFHLVFDQGISIIGLIGFIMALGIVVDDAIVVGEDALTHFEQGKSPLDAAIGGATRMWVPVVTSSLTTLAAFIPLLLIGGVMGDIILTLPMVLLCIMLASLVECFLVLPGHLKVSLSNVKPVAPDSWRTRFDSAFFGFRDKKFMPLVRKALDYPGATLCAAIGGVLIAFSLMASQHVAFNLVTGFDFETLEAQVEFASTATDEQKVAFIDHLQEGLNKVNEAHPGDNAKGWISKSNLAKFNEERLTGEQYASIQVFFAFEETRTISPQDFVNEWQAGIERPPYIEQLTIGVAGGQNNGQADITLVLRGQNIDSLKEGAEQLSSLLAAYPGVSNVTDNLPYGREQIIFRITPRGRALGLTPAAIGSQLRAAYDGTRVQILNENLSEVEVRVMLPDDERDHLGRLQQFPIRTLDGEIIPLSNAAQLYTRRGIDLIRHSNTQMAARVSADVDSDVNNAMAIISDIKVNGLDAILDQHDLTFGLSGKSEQDEIILKTMALGGVLTLVLIYLILAWVFASYLWPASIMMAIPFGFTGAVIGHWVTGWDVGAMSMLAFFALTGIVVNDSIVLISFLKRDIEAGANLREALERAVSARYRAVILTSLTTIAGLAPLMFETSSLAFYVAPLAVTICFGLAFSTLLVLLVIPAMILLLEGAKASLGRFATSLISSAKGALS